jgi:hypothetical protein
MKTTIISFACSLFFLSNVNVLFSQVPFKTDDLKHTVATSLAARGVISNSGQVSINKKIEKYFTRNFAAIPAGTWSMAGKNFHYRFYLNGIPAEALFAKNGYLIYLVRHGNEKNMSSDVRQIVKSKYFDYTITNAIEVKQNGEDIWILKMKENSDHLTVRVEDGQMEVVENFKEL